MQELRDLWFCQKREKIDKLNLAEFGFSIKSPEFYFPVKPGQLINTFSR